LAPSPWKLLAAAFEAPYPFLPNPGDIASFRFQDVYVPSLPAFCISFPGTVLEAWGKRVEIALVPIQNTRLNLLPAAAGRANFFPTRII
jgi:hypothetical protein